MGANENFFWLGIVAAGWLFVGFIVLSMKITNTLIGDYKWVTVKQVTEKEGEAEAHDIQYLKSVFHSRAVVGDIIHYPKCWDIEKFKTVESALDLVLDLVCFLRAMPSREIACKECGKKIETTLLGGNNGR